MLSILYGNIIKSTSKTEHIKLTATRWDIYVHYIQIKRNQFSIS